MPLAFPHEIRDPIHGLIPLTDQEIQLINTSAFQRLRRIRQLAMADLVYPGALHTRFEHVIGTMHVADRIFRNLGAKGQLPHNGEEQTFDYDHRLVRLAALLHDIGHGPFSHVSEHLLEEFTDRTALKDVSQREKIHELVTIGIVAGVGEISSLLSEGERRDVVAIIRGTGSRDFRRDMVSSALDADKMDYLLRDAHYAGVRYGQFDLDKVIESCRLLAPEHESYLAIDHEGIYAVEQVLLSKHYMTQQVYAHRIRTVTDAMIVRGLELAILANEGLRAVYSYDGSAEHLSRYLDEDDSTISQKVLSCGEPRAADIFGRLRERRLFKELALLSLDAMSLPDALIRRRLLNLSREEVSKIEAAVAGHLGREGNRPPQEEHQESGVSAFRGDRA